MNFRYTTCFFFYYMSHSHDILVFVMPHAIFTYTISPFTFDLKSHLPGTCVFCGRPHLEEAGKVGPLRRLRIPSLPPRLKQ